MILTRARSHRIQRRSGHSLNGHCWTWRSPSGAVLQSMSCRRFRPPEPASNVRK